MRAKSPSGAASLLRALAPILVVRTGGRPELEPEGPMTLLEAETGTLRPGASAILGQLASTLFALLLRATAMGADFQS